MYKSLRDCADDLEKHGMLIRIKEEVDPDLEMAEIHRQVYDKQGPALLFERVKGSPFQALSNLYGTFERTDFIFRKTKDNAAKIMGLKVDPSRLLRNPLKYWNTPFIALKALPLKIAGRASSMYEETKISLLPQIKSWPMDGGAFITLPQVLSSDPLKPGIMHTNIGMYRIQLSGNEYETDKEVGLHYQLHRGIGVHHTQYNQLKKPFKVAIFVGGPPSHAVAAIFPLPEGLSEVTFAGLLGGRRFRYKDQDGYIISADADFVITGEIIPGLKKPEGPFGDHIGYYSLEHDFPVMKVDKVYHRKDPIWHFTVVGRPPAEDSSFGHIIHQLVSNLTPGEFPGLKELHAVDAAGVHPLLLAIGNERYMPFREKRPEEILTIANRILGTGQTSLAKYLIIAADEKGDQHLDTHHITEFLKFVLERVDWTRDLHFQTNTTIDTLDYSGDGWNAGSKVVIAAYGDPVRVLSKRVGEALVLPDGFDHPKATMEGILIFKGPSWTSYTQSDIEMAILCDTLKTNDLRGFPLIVLVDEPDFTAETLNNFLWVTFTRSNPARDIYGIDSFVTYKHWGCKGSLIIDARIKSHHAPELKPDPVIQEKVKNLLTRYHL